MASGVECRTGGRQIRWLDATGDCFHNRSTPVEKCHIFRKRLNSISKLYLLLKRIAVEGHLDGLVG